MGALLLHDVVDLVHVQSVLVLPLEEPGALLTLKLLMALPMVFKVDRNCEHALKMIYEFVR